MNAYSYELLNDRIRAGSVYRRDMLLSYSKALDRDLDILVKKKFLRKLAGGLYYKPVVSEFGVLPPQDEDLIGGFLRDNKFLLYSWNQYNSLGIGLTQLYNRVIVLNRKRHGVFKLGNKEFDFRRTNKGFPRKVSYEFLLVDLLNNLNDLAEDTSSIKDNIRKKLNYVEKKKMMQFAKSYGKISTKKFFEEFFNERSVSAPAS